MWGRRDPKEVTCIACGASLDRPDAREYDKEGDRWERREKEFEYLCKPCHRELCHQPRRGLESLLADIEAESVPAGRFVERYYDAVKDDCEAEERGDRSGDA
ncbi:small CPxCG-related zinc finger protein [Natronomonas moolapensis 8.8.11]|uniref:Small CPxCG-related zinc finger protein n=1 Tax=Natronomonas moolapensis (strain DSM 18674 / CECT 7526 / JCM 14361 / 8.8.11) TaxID=268739 RepID=M1XN34_NATM8|nr:hypothetical protein [Natronomonas moolapensis]CCQ35305.1 small CPxCG-related zinc finger protein [Natronomonas moolapensis 8.8.11]